MNITDVIRIAAFAEGTLEGNPAGVVILLPDLAWPNDEELQALAAEVGYSETAYVRPTASAVNEFGLRWFTPKAEVDLCGHATLAAAFVLWEMDAVPERQPITFDSRSGPLPITKGTDSGRISMNFPADPPHPLHDSGIKERIAAALGVSRSAIIDAFCGRDDSAVVLSEECEVFRCVPDTEAVAAIPHARGVIVTAKAAADSTADFTSRFFVPGYGIPRIR